MLKGRVYMKSKGRSKNSIAVVLVIALLIMHAGIHIDARAAAQNAMEAVEQTRIEAADRTGKEAADDLVEIRVEGSLEEIDRMLILDRLNEIREEACREGVQNPIDGEPMKQEDYVPLEWSYELEKIAALRAVESTILQDHIRPDGSECFSAAPEGVSFTMEALAWGFGSAVAAIEGWYSEKAAYVGATGTPAGHYIALISPENRFVGIADLRAEWQRDACAGAFASHGSAGTGNAGYAEADHLPENGGSETDKENSDVESVTEEWSVPLLRSYLPAVIEKAVSVTSVRISNAARHLK